MFPWCATSGQSYENMPIGTLKYDQTRDGHQQGDLNRLQGSRAWACTVLECYLEFGIRNALALA